jgi:3-hydroxybutyryl-CoA dehydrogenase
MTANIKDVGVLGLGVMGLDIAFLYAMNGHRTLAYDTAKNVMEAFPERCEQTIERLRKRNRISQIEVQHVREHLILAPEFSALAQTDLVTEAVSEVGKTKISAYRALQDVGFSGILTTNTSSLTRSALLADKPYDPNKFATTHFFNPVLHTRMVEIVTGDMDQHQFRLLLSFLKTVERTPVETQDISGFVSNSVLMYYAVMSLNLLQSGARVEQVDETAKKLGLLPPFTSFDSWKPSIVEDVTRVMSETRGDDFLRSSALLSTLAKTNPYFYVAQKPNPEIYNCIDKSYDSLNSSVIERALKVAIHAAAARVVELGEDPEKVDLISTVGIKIPQPPLREIDNIGAGAIIQEIDAVNDAIAGPRLTPPRILIALAKQGQTFYCGEQPNPWISTFLGEQRFHAGR